MNEYKPQPTALFIGIAIGVIFVGLMVTAWIKGPNVGWTGDKRIIVELSLLSACLVLLLFVKFYEVILLKLASTKGALWILFYDRNKQRQGGAEPSAQSDEHARGRGGALRDALRAMHGRRWCYRQPWLLLTGNDNGIGRLRPELAESGWRITPEAVLLWCKTGADGQPDMAWLKQVYQLRRRRPVDAVLLVTDDAEDVGAERRGFDDGVRLARIANTLRWSAPVFALGVGQTDGVSPVIACEVPPQADVAAIDGALRLLRTELAERSIWQPTENGSTRYLGELSQRLDSRARPLAQYLASLATAARGRMSLRGVIFSPVPATGQGDTSADLPVWRYVCEAAQQQPGRRTAWHPLTLCAGLVLAALGLWTTGMLISGLQNQRDIHTAQQAAHDIRTAPNEAARLKSLLTLQQEIERYEHRTGHHAPLMTRFGLNRDPEVLAALWKPYAQASRQVLVTPAQQDLEASLVDLAQMQTTNLSDETSRWALGGHDTLKTYLMLAQPEKTEAAFLAPQLTQHWSTEARITPGEKQDMAERLFRFYAEHLKANPDWRIEPRPELVSGARQTLLAVIGERNAQDTIYQGIVDGAGNKFPDQALVSLTTGTDPRGMLRAAAIVPGIFTRQAYEGYVAPAIEEAARRKQVATDWVLTGGKPSQPAADDDSGKDLQAALTEQYFADYADRWQGFMNSLQWESAPTLPAAIDQLKLMADARQSPVIALMKSLEYQGGAGARKDSLSDTLVNKAKDLLGKKSEVPEMAKADPAGPLGAAFGPVLRLVGSQAANGNAGASGDLSLQRYLDRVTALRLRLQQVSSSADGDAQARQIAQALFQGKGSDLADTQTYAQLIAASLGTQWAGMGEALFVRPIAQATQTMLQPAQASLNEAWRQGVVMAWGRVFAGRYPFADSANDASLPELTRFLRPQTGLIGAFLGTQLAGVLELQGDQWVPAASGVQAVALDPAFLKAINMLQRIGMHLLAQGEPQYRFEVKPIPTPGLTDTVLTVDGQKLHYYNQRESWQAMSWPTNSLQDLGTRLQWQTEQAGTNKSYEFGGRWGLVRMLERARIEPLDSATYQLTWRGVPDTTGPRASAGERPANGGGQATAGVVDGDADSRTARAAKLPPPAEVTYPLSYQMRTEAGQGPLEMLWLRGFVLPTRIFAGREPQDVARAAQAARRLQAE